MMPSHANTLNVPQDLRTYRQFVTWRLVNRPDKPKPTKLPNGSTTDPSTWKSYDEAVAELNADSTLAGIGFVFTEDDPFVFVDIDNCLQDDGSWHADALAMIQSTPGMTWEASQSGRGLHGIGLADKTKLKRKRNRWKSPAGIGFEFYYTARYVAFGHLNWTKPEPGDVTKYILKYVPDREDAVDTSDDLIDGQRPHYSGPKSDKELIKRARSATGSAAAAFGNAATFEDLWTGNAARLAQFYPANNGGDGFDHSAADAALIAHLAFWTGYDEVRMIRLFSQSALGQRDKWTKRPDYRVRTLKAITSNADGRYIGTDARTPSENSLNRQTGGNEEIAAVSITKRASDLKDRLLNVSCIGPVLQNNYLIKGWLDQGCLSVFYGPSNCGKTFVAVDIGMHVGASATWRGRKVNGGAVLYIAAEGGAGIKNRLAAIKKDRPELANANFYLLPTGIDLHSVGDAQAVCEIIPCTKLVLVLVDTLARCMGAGDENAAKDMAQFVNNCDVIRKATGAHVMVIHHTGKDEERGARGSSALRAAADNEIQVTAKGEIVSRKQRDQEAPPPLFFKLRTVFLGDDEDGDPVTSAVVDGTTKPNSDLISLSSQNAAALRALDEAIDAHGKKVNGDLYPKDRDGVTLDQWRGCCDRVRLTRGVSESAARTAFGRAKSKLIQANKIFVLDNYVWRLS